MSAADRMAVRTPDGNIRSVPRRVGLAMIAQSRARHAPGQSAPRPGTKGQRPASAIQVVTADAPALKPGEIELPATQYDGPSLADVGMTQADLLPDVKAERGPIEYPNVDASALPIEAPAVKRPKGNAGRAAWAQYAGIVGVAVDDEMGRNEIRDAVVAHEESARMSQPAFGEFEGGRLATPEDEPVTESAVTHADPGEPKP